MMRRFKLLRISTVLITKGLTEGNIVNCRVEKGVPWDAVITYSITDGNYVYLVMEHDSFDEVYVNLAKAGWYLDLPDLTVTIASRPGV